jgi:hypothetical protein
MFDVCTTGDTAHIDTIFKLLPYTRQHRCIDIFTAASIRAFRSARSRSNGRTNTRSLTYPQRKKSQDVMSGDLGVIATVVGHFQTHALSNVLVTLCSGTVIFIRQLLYHLDAAWFKHQTLTQNPPHRCFQHR